MAAATVSLSEILIGALASVVGLVVIGCRADFQIGSDRGWRPDEDRDRDRRDNNLTTITCSSDDMRRHHCPADTRGGVQLVRQRSEANCIYGQTWGFDRSSIWVDRGCRADFQLTNRR